MMNVEIAAPVVLFVYALVGAGIALGMELSDKETLALEVSGWAAIAYLVMLLA